MRSSRIGRMEVPSHVQRDFQSSVSKPYGRTEAARTAAAGGPGRHQLCGGFSRRDTTETARRRAPVQGLEREHSAPGWVAGAVPFHTAPTGWVRHSVCVRDVALRSAGRSLRPVTARWCWSPRPRRPGRQRQSKRTGHRTRRQRGDDGHHDRTGRNARHAGVNLGPGGDTTSSAAITRRVGHG